jgi:hypothetical protein
MNVAFVVAAEVRGLDRGLPLERRRRVVDALALRGVADLLLRAEVLLRERLLLALHDGLAIGEVDLIGLEPRGLLLALHDLARGALDLLLGRRAAREQVGVALRRAERLVVREARLLRRALAGVAEELLLVVQAAQHLSVLELRGRPPQRARDARELAALADRDAGPDVEAAQQPREAVDLGHDHQRVPQRRGKLVELVEDLGRGVQHLVQQEHRAAEHVERAGLRESRAELLEVVDDGAELLAERVERLVELADRRPLRLLGVRRLHHLVVELHVLEERDEHAGELAAGGHQGARDLLDARAGRAVRLLERLPEELRVLLGGVEPGGLEPLLPGRGQHVRGRARDRRADVLAGGAGQAGAGHDQRDELLVVAAREAERAGGLRDAGGDLADVAAEAVLRVVDRVEHGRELRGVEAEPGDDRGQVAGGRRGVELADLHGEEGLPSGVQRVGLVVEHLRHAVGGVGDLTDRQVHLVRELAELLLRGVGVESAGDDARELVHAAVGVDRAAPERADGPERAVDGRRGAGPARELADRAADLLAELAERDLPAARGVDELRRQVAMPLHGVARESNRPRGLLQRRLEPLVLLRDAARAERDVALLGGEALAGGRGAAVAVDDAAEVAGLAVVAGGRDGTRAGRAAGAARAAGLQVGLLGAGADLGRRQAALVATGGAAGAREREPLRLDDPRFAAGGLLGGPGGARGALAGLCQPLGLVGAALDGRGLLCRRDVAEAGAPSLRFRSRPSLGAALLLRGLASELARLREVLPQLAEDAPEVALEPPHLGPVERVSAVVGHLCPISQRAASGLPRSQPCRHRRRPRPSSRAPARG